MTLHYKAAVLYEPGAPLVIEHAEAAPLGLRDGRWVRGSSLRVKSRKGWRRDDDRERRAVPVVPPAAERPPRSSVQQRR
jgi:hypothetical protein